MSEPTHLREALKFQFEIAWQLLEYHLNHLENEEMFWKPTTNSLHVLKKDNLWQADWPETESDDMGPPSIAWTTWHIQFWWSMTLDYSFGKGTLSKEDIQWSGDVEEVKKTLVELKTKWLEKIEKLTDEELLSSDFSKWPFEGQPYYQIIGWLNVELMKNATEIGNVRFMYGSKNKQWEVISMSIGAFSISLNVKDIKASKEFYEKLGFKDLGGNIDENWLILKNEDVIIGLFQGMFEENILTFNPGWDENAQNVDPFTDVRELQEMWRAQGIELIEEADTETTGPAYITLQDPDGNVILVDQHR